MINKALDLPFDEPQETYSTSAHLFHDLGIPSGTKGRIVPSAPEPRRDEAPRERTRHERAPRERSRTRTRSGQNVAGSSPETPAAVASGEQAAGGERAGGQGRRRSRRRRPRSSGPSSAAS
jgi:hypothetical protein